jgi:DTW domain-containing protein YfiP
MLPPVETRLAVHVLIHRHEHAKPSSTGRLIARVVTGAACHVYQRENRFFPASGFPIAAVEPGEPLPASPVAGTTPSDTPQPILLLDGTWRQAGEMLRSLEGVGRCVSLPYACIEPSRYWLRDQPTAAQLSTAEALLGVLHAVGETEAEERLRMHFELHVYATLLSRGRREMAERYLGHSPLLSAAPAIVDQLLPARHRARLLARAGSTRTRI